MKKRTYSIIEQDIDTDKFYEKIGVSKDFIDNTREIIQAHEKEYKGIHAVELSKKLAANCTKDSELLLVGYYMGQIVTRIDYTNRVNRESDMLDLMTEALKSKLYK